MKPLLQNGLQPFIALGDHGFELAVMDGEWQISYMIRHMACVFYKKTSSAQENTYNLFTTILVCLCSTVGERNQADVVWDRKAHD